MRRRSAWLITGISIPIIIVLRFLYADQAREWRVLRTSLYSAGDAGSTEPRTRVSAFGHDSSRGPAPCAGGSRAVGATLLR